MAEVGRPSVLDDEQFLLKIRECILEGKNLTETAKTLGIPYETMRYWKWLNFHGFADALMTYKHEYMLSLAEDNLEEAMMVDHIEPAIGAFGPIFDRETKEQVFKVNPHILKIKTETAQFVSETLGRRNYHKKQEINAHGEFTTYEIIRGNEQGTDRPVPQSVSAMASGSVSAVEPVAIQDSGSGTQSA